MFLAGSLREFGLASHTNAMVIEIVKIIFPLMIFDAQSLQCTIAIATVKYLAPVEHDWFVHPVRLDVGNQRVELRALHQREHVRERVERNLLQFGRIRARAGRPSYKPSVSLQAAVTSGGLRRIRHRTRES